MATLRNRSRRAMWPLFFAGLCAVILVELFLANPAASVVKPSLCSADVSSPDLITSPFHCPTFTEHERGKPWVFSRTLSPAPTGQTTNLTSLFDARAASGFDGLALVGDLLVSIALALAVTVVVAGVGSWRRRRRR